MRRAISIALVVIWALSISACNIGKGKEEAEQVAEQLFETRIDNGWSGTERFYSEAFFGGENREKWSTILRIVTKAMGRLENYTLSEWNVSTKFQTGEISGILVTLEYDTYYEKGTGRETLMIRKPFLGGEFLIISHHFNSDLIQQLIDKGIDQAASEDSV